MNAIDDARKKLKEAWQAFEELHEAPGDMSLDDYSRWSGLTKDLLFGLGMFWEPDKLDYDFDPIHQQTETQGNLVEDNEALTP